MLKLLGSVLVMAGALWCGAGAVGQLRRRVRALENLRAGLVWMEEELAFRLTPLPKLLEHLGREQTGAVALFFQDALAGLRQDPEEGLRQSWRQAMVRRLDFLREEERQVLMEVGRTLGRFDAKTQRQALAQAARRLDAIRAGAEGESKRLGRVYASLSFALGAAVVLVLL